TAGRYDAALTAARSAEQIAMEIQAQNVVPGELLEQVVAAARALQQKAEEEKRRTPTISDRPGDRQLVGTSLSSLGDRRLPYSLNLDTAMPHHGTSDAHEQRALEFDGAGRVSDSTWPTSLAVPTVLSMARR
ncbi:MAG: hypothetical protein HC861_09375, partial [Rhodospirillaceae bacterium]|nr:hypothetical protein [Rhodospirillaceae bacterium]